MVKFFKIFQPLTRAADCAKISAVLTKERTMLTFLACMIVSLVLFLTIFRGECFRGESAFAGVLVGFICGFVLSTILTLASPDDTEVQRMDIAPLQAENDGGRTLPQFALLLEDGKSFLAFRYLKTHETGGSISGKAKVPLSDINFIVGSDGQGAFLVIRTTRTRKSWRLWTIPKTNRTQHLYLPRNASFRLTATETISPL